MPFYRVGPDGTLTRLHLGIVQPDGSIQPHLAPPVPQRGRVHEAGVIAPLLPPAPQRGRVHETGIIGTAWVAPVTPQRGRIHETAVHGTAWVPPEPDPQRGRVHEVSLEAIPA